MRRFLFVLSVSLIVFLVLIVNFGCGKSNYDLAKKEKKQKEEQLQKENDFKKNKDQEIIEKLINKHKSVIPLHKSGLLQFGSNGMYTLDIQKVFLNKDQAPILFTGIVSDVHKEKDGYIVNAKWGGTTFRRLCSIFLCNPLFHFKLNCKKDHISYITGDRENQKFAIVAQIDSVRKVRIVLQAESKGDDGSFVTIESGELNDYLVTGKCIDFQRISFTYY